MSKSLERGKRAMASPYIGSRGGGRFGGHASSQLLHIAPSSILIHSGSWDPSSFFGAEEGEIMALHIKHLLTGHGDSTATRQAWSVPTSILVGGHTIRGVTSIVTHVGGTLGVVDVTSM